MSERLTASDFLTWLAKQPDGAKYELLDGRVPRAETGTIDHGELIERISERLARPVRARGCRKYTTYRTDENGAATIETYGIDAPRIRALLSSGL